MFSDCLHGGSPSPCVFQEENKFPVCSRGKQIFLLIIQKIRKNTVHMTIYILLLFWGGLNMSQEYLAYQSNHNTFHLICLTLEGVE